MSLNSYNAIKAAVASWMNRSDLTDKIPDFINLAEARMRRLLRDNVNLAASTQITFSSAYANLPDDFNGVVSLSAGTVSRGRLRYITVAEFSDRPPQGGLPCEYTVFNGQIAVWPGPGEATTLTLRYTQRFDLLNLGSNWILDNHPDAYLFGALVEASAFMVEDERIGLWQSRFNDVMDEINREGVSNAMSGPLQVKSSGGA